MTSWWRNRLMFWIYFLKLWVFESSKCSNLPSVRVFQVFGSSKCSDLPSVRIFQVFGSSKCSELPSVPSTIPIGFILDMWNRLKLRWRHDDVIAWCFNNFLKLWHLSLYAENETCYIQNSSCNRFDKSCPKLGKKLWCDHDIKSGFFLYTLKTRFDRDKILVGT